MGQENKSRAEALEKAFEDGAGDGPLIEKPGLDRPTPTPPSPTPTPSVTPSPSPRPSPTPSSGGTDRSEPKSKRL